MRRARVTNNEFVQSNECEHDAEYTMTQDELDLALDLHWRALQDRRDGEFADFTGADLSGLALESRVLRGISFRGANLRGARLSRASLRRADFTEADLTGADLSHALCLSTRFVRATLVDVLFASACMSCADLTDAELPEGLPVVDNIDAAILQVLKDNPHNTLYMGAWHVCATTHCRAGWAIHLAGAAGVRLELDIGPDAAGALIYAASGSHPVPDWTAVCPDALFDLRYRAGVST